MSPGYADHEVTSTDGAERTWTAVVMLGFDRRRKAEQSGR